MTITNRSTSSGRLHFTLTLLAASLLSAGTLAAQDRGPKKDPAPVQDVARAAAERGLKLALDKMVTAEKLTAAQASEMVAIAFPRAQSEEARFEAYLKENPRMAKAIEVGRLTREQALAGFRARSGAGPTNHEREVAFGRYCNDLIESGQVERFDADLKKVHDIGVEEIRRQGTLAQGTQEPAAGSIRNLTFSVYEVEDGNWDQVLGKTLLLSEKEPLARGRAASGLLDLQLRDQALPDRAGRASFAMRFEGLLTAREAGQYTFRLRADDQAQLFLNGKLAASYHGNAEGAAKVVEVALAVGDHKLQVDFADWGGAWWLELAMTEPGGQEVALSSAAKGFEGEGRARRRGKEKLAAREPVPVDWDAEYEAFLGANPKVKEQVEAGRITKDQVLAGLKARAKEVEPEEDPEVAALLARFEAMRPGSGESLRKMLAEGRLTKEDLLARLDGRGARKRAQEPEAPMKGEDEPGRGAGEGRGGEDPAPEAKPLSREEYARIAAEIEAAVAAGKLTAEQGREKLVELRRSMGRRREAPKRVDWDAEYEAFLKANPKVREQVAAGKVTKDQVLAGIKARAKEAEPEKDPELEGILARFEAMRPGSAEMLRQSLAEGRITKEALLARLRGIGERGRGEGAGEGDPDRKGDGEEPPPKRGGGEKRSGEGDDERSKRGDGGR